MIEFISSEIFSKFILNLFLAIAMLSLSIFIISGVLAVILTMVLDLDIPNRLRDLKRDLKLLFIDFRRW